MNRNPRKSPLVPTRPGSPLLTSTSTQTTAPRPRCTTLSGGKKSRSLTGCWQPEPTLTSSFTQQRQTTPTRTMRTPSRDSSGSFCTAYSLLPWSCYRDFRAALFMLHTCVFITLLSMNIKLRLLGEQVFLRVASKLMSVTRTTLEKLRK